MPVRFVDNNRTNTSKHSQWTAGKIIDWSGKIWASGVFRLDGLEKLLIAYNEMEKRGAP